MKTRLMLISIVAIFLSPGCKKKDEPVSKVKAAFSVSSTNPAIDEAVNFTNQSENADYFQWDFGDDNISVDENPVHTFSSPGNFKVILKAIGNNSSDTVSTHIRVDVPEGMVSIFEGTGITGLTILEDTWETMLSSFPVENADTSFISAYLSDYGVYLNQIYYPNEGIVGVFFSEGDYIAKTDPLVGLILWPPYDGFTIKNITIGSTMAAVTDVYGIADPIYNTNSYLGYSYPLKGIDFYSYKDIDVTIVSEIDLYPAQSARKSSWPDIRKYAGRFSERKVRMK